MFRRIAALVLILTANLMWAAPTSAAHASTAQGPQMFCSVGKVTGAGRCYTHTPAPKKHPYYTVAFNLASVSPSSVIGWDVPSGNTHYGIRDPYGCLAGDLHCVLSVYPSDSDDIELTVTAFYHTTSIIVYYSSATATMPGRCAIPC